MILDVFNDSAFSLTSLTKAINLVPYAPTRIGSSGLFSSQGVRTLSIAIEMQSGKLTLVPTKPRGAPGVVKGLERRNVRDFRPVHLPQRVALLADEIQGLRAMGSETDVEVASAYLAKKLLVPRRDLDVTHEYQRIGAIKGLVVDADGTTPIYNYFTEFGVAQQEHDMVLDVDGTKVLQKTVTLKTMIEDTLGAVMMTGVRVYCSAGFFAALTGHPAVVEAFRRYNESSFLREDNRTGFEFGSGVFWEQYRGQVDGIPFIEANCAYAVPLGVPDLFETYYAPANYMETVNTEGLPFYVKQERMRMDTGIDVEMQSNPLHICTRPNAIIRLGVNAAALA